MRRQTGGALIQSSTTPNREPSGKRWQRGGGEEGRRGEWLMGSQWRYGVWLSLDIGIWTRKDLGSNPNILDLPVGLREQVTLTPTRSLITLNYTHTQLYRLCYNYKQNNTEDPSPHLGPWGAAGPGPGPVWPRCRWVGGSPSHCDRWGSPGGPRPRLRARRRTGPTGALRGQPEETWLCSGKERTLLSVGLLNGFGLVEICMCVPWYGVMFLRGWRSLCWFYFSTKHKLASWGGVGVKG